ncbi:MAG TPA: lysine biosynthesis protein LysW [Vicinamibacteria bacterium]|nr:lysine biosynthesis protein LysW [Vicinamibacteria bacterium]
MSQDYFPLCPACDTEIEIDALDVDPGERIGCPECGVTLQVLAVDPIDLDIAEEEIKEWKEQ